MLTVAVARSFFDSNAISCILPVLWMTSYFHPMEHMDQNKDDGYVSSSSPDSGTKGEGCRLQLHLIMFATFERKIGVHRASY